MLPKHSRYRAEDLCRVSFFIVDSFAIFGGLVLSYYIRFDVLGRALPPESFLAPIGGRGIESYAESIVLGGGLLQLILLLKEAYDNKTLLRFRCSFFLLFKSLIIWAVTPAGVSLILEFDVLLSRLFVIISFSVLLVLLSVARRCNVHSLKQTLPARCGSAFFLSIGPIRLPELRQRRCGTGGLPTSSSGAHRIAATASPTNAPQAFPSSVGMRTSRLFAKGE